jgi:hypothetical protein
MSNERKVKSSNEKVKSSIERSIARSQNGEANLWVRQNAPAVLNSQGRHGRGDGNLRLLGEGRAPLRWDTRSVQGEGKSA